MPPAPRSASVPGHAGGADPQETPKGAQNQREAAASQGLGLEVPQLQLLAGLGCGQAAATGSAQTFTSPQAPGSPPHIYLEAGKLGRKVWFPPDTLLHPAPSSPASRDGRTG